MFESPAYFSPPPSSLRLQQQELQLYQSTSAVMSNRERDRLAGRLSPEPHLEMMRPVSPFQSKRQFPHQKPHSNIQSTALSTSYQPQFNLQPYAPANPTRVEVTNSSHSSPSPHTRPKLYKTDGRSSRAAHKDSDISPALRMMSYETTATPPSSDGGHGRSTQSHSSRETHNSHDRTEHNRSTSPESGRRRNPGWRKPAPKYIPTPPSTPPSSASEHLPVTMNEPVPPVPSNNRPYHGKTRSTPSQPSQSPPPRPARAETVPHIPVMFVDRTATIDSSRAKIVPTHAPRQTGQAFSSSKTTSASLANLSGVSHAQVHPSPTARNLLSTQARIITQVPSQTRTVTAHSMHAAPIQPAVLKGPDVKNGPQKSTLVHPQPKKVPSMAQLVAMVLPSRSPSPKPSTPEAVPTRTEKEMIDTAQPLKSFVAVQSQSQALTPKLTVKDTSSRTPSPAIHGDHGTYSATSRTHLQPYQVSLPPSTGSSAKSSRSVSPYSSPTKVAVSLPIRSRSPTPVIPQYAPPAPPFPPPPPNTPIYAPRPKSLILPQSKLVAILAEQAQYENNEAEQISTKSTQAEEQRPTIEHDRTPSPHSGMVTPPTTPPSSKKAQTTTINEDVQATSILSMTNSRPHSPALPSTTVSLPVHRHVTTIPLSSLQQVEDIPVREDSPSILRPTTPPPMLSTLALAPPPTLANVMTKEMHAPPCKLPSDWKETITRVTRSSAIPNLQEPTQAGFDEALSMLPPIKPTLQALPEGRDDGASAYVNTGAWLEQIEQATTALGLEIHEVEQRRASKIVDVNLSLDDKGKEIALISSSPQIYPSPLEVASQKSTPTSVTKQRITHELPMLGSSNLTKPVGLPPRSRSPIQRSKTPQRIAAVTQPQDNEEDWSLIAPELESLLAGTFFSPPQSADSTSRSHSSGPRKRPKTPRPRVEGREVIQQNMHLGVPQEIPDCAVVTVSPQVVPSELPSSRCISPPPRNQSLGPKKRSPRLDPGHTEYSDTESSHAHSSSSLPRNQALVTKKRSTPTGSDLGHVENNDQESGRTHPSSPLPRNQNSPGTKKRYPPTGSETGHIEYNDQESGVTYSSSPVPKDQVLGTKKSNPPTYSDSGHVAYNDQESSHSHPSSPPSRNQFLSTKKQYPHIGSDSDHIEYNDQEPSHTYPSSPPSTARLLSQSRQTQATTKSPRGHGQHKRLPTPEMTQTFRPPTPPLPSHYKKKRSNDVLPSEPFSAFIKPAVHVIYPDTSTSYGHSMSGDSVLVMAGPKPPPNYRPVYPEVNDDLPPNRGERKRQLAQSPSPVTSLVSLDKEQEKAYETPEALIDCPPAPPKSQRHDVIAQEPSLGHDQYPDFTIQHASRGRYTSAPIGQARAHTLTLPSASSRSRATHTHGHRTERSPSTTSRSRRTQQPHATKAARSLSEKVPVNKNNVQPLARSKSSPLPSSRHHQRRGFWRLFGLWARVFMSKFKTWTSPSPSIDHDY